MRYQGIIHVRAGTINDTNSDDLADTDEVEEFDDSVRVTSAGCTIKGTYVKTAPYPGFPTDMNPQMGVLMTVAEGESLIKEGVWDNRFKYVDELIRMGANIKSDSRSATFTGVKKLHGAPVTACDLRAGAAFIIAGLMADGVTEIDNIYHIQRGYEDIVGKLKRVGADIELKYFPDDTGMVNNTAG